MTLRASTAGPVRGSSHRLDELVFDAVEDPDVLDCGCDAWRGCDCCAYEGAD
jgi:hypothetical protein